MPAVGHVRDMMRLSAAAVRDVNEIPRLLAVSEATRDFHVGQGVDAGRLRVLYNGVDPREFGRGRALRGLRARHTDGLVVATIGQIGLRKGTDVFVELARCILERRTDVHFFIIGERTSTKAEAVQLEADLRDQASRPPCRDHVHFLGTRNDVPQILSQVDIVVHAARQEPLSRVLLESAAAGKAIVATDVGGTREIFPHESRAAVVVPPCQAVDVRASELFLATMQLLDDPAKRESLAVAARCQRAG
jgi:glycosyltransferase involved in cell wall biosynthesis